MGKKGRGQKDDIWGIKIRRPKKERERDPDAKGEYIIIRRYDLFFARRRKHGDQMFITNRKIHETIRKIGPGKLKGKNIGEIKVVGTTGGKELAIVNYFPTGDKSEWPMFKGINISTLAEGAVEKDLLRDFPGYRRKFLRTREPERERQVIRRGIKPEEAMPLKEAVELTQRKIRSDARRRASKARVARAARLRSQAQGKPLKRRPR